MLFPLVSEDAPLIGLEPSAILTFRDEYIDLADDTWLPKARELAKHVMTIEEFLSKEMEKGNIRKELFKPEKKSIRVHGHCQQKALSSIAFSRNILQFPEGYSVEVIPSGCCGMAGSFGYEKEHYDLSMKIGELVLFPAVRNAGSNTLIAAPGTSCRHQVKDGTGQLALHPVEILFDALK
jgi:Fe-S oxidoreductase